MTSAAFAAPPVPDEVGGQIEAVVDGQKVTFPALKTDIKADIKGDLVTVKVTQTFENPSDKPVHASYLFPLSHNAAVNHMVMTVGDERVEARIKRTEEAKATFQQAKQEGKVASLLTEYRPNMFTQNIANLMPGMPVEVTLTYVETLAKIDGQYELVLPLIVGPRYQPAGAGIAPAPASQVSSKEKLDKWELEQLPGYPAVAGLTIPDTLEKDRVAINISLDGGLPITAVSSATHAITEEKQSETKSLIHLAEGRTIDNKDFVLRYSLSGSAPQAGMLAYKDSRGGFFSLQLEPPAAPAVKDIAPREMVFVLDTSGSMNGEPIEASKLFMKHALNSMRASDYFRIIRFSNNAEEFTSGPVPATTENIEKGQKYVASLTADGGTEIPTAINQAFGIAPKDGTLRMVVFLTDGYIGNEASVLSLTSEKMGAARIFALGVGTSVNRYLLEEMGRIGNGYARFIDPTEKADDVAIQLANKLESPVLTDISIDWGDLKAREFTPVRIPDLFAGSSIRIQGQYEQSGKHTITVHGLVNGRKASLPVTVDLPEASDEKDSPIPVIWARAQIAEAMRQINSPSYRRAPELSEDKIKLKVTDLGLDFSLMTRWTSFVAVSDKVVNEHPESTEQKDVPLPMVAGVTAKAYGQSFSGASAPEPSTIAGMIILAAMAGALFYCRRKRESDFHAYLYVLAFLIRRSTRRKGKDHA